MNLRIICLSLVRVRLLRFYVLRVLLVKHVRGDIRSICRMSLKELRDKLAGYIEDLEWEVDMRENGHTKAYQERARKRLGGKLSPYWESVHKKIRKG